MVVSRLRRKIPKHSSSRNILPYFLESMVWKKYEETVVNNYAHWVCEDPIRARKMYAASNHKRKGYTVQDYLYDMVDCVYKSKLKNSTRYRLFDEIDEVEAYHEEMQTILEVM